jgi:HEAT repeat protein
MTVSGLVLAAAGLAADEPLKAPKETYRGKTAKQWASKLTDQDWGERWWAAEALAEIGPGAKEVVPDLIKALKDPEHFVRGSAAKALGKIGPAAVEAVPALAVMLEDPSRLTRPYALVALAKIGPVSKLSKEAEDVFVRHLGHEDQVVRDNAIETFRHAGKAGKPPVPALIALLKDKNGHGKLYAVQAIQDIGPAAGEATSALVGLIHNSDESLRRSAIPTLEKINPDRKHLSPILISALNASDPEVRLQAVTALGQVRLLPKDAVPALVDLLKDKNSLTKKRAMEALGSMGPVAGDAAPAIAHLVRDPDQSLSRSAMAAVEKVRPTWKKDVSILISVLKASDTEVRLTAVKALSMIRPLSRDGVFALNAALEDNDKRVVLAAGTVLDESGLLKEVVPKLMASLAASDLETRLNAATALGTMRQPSQEAVRALVNLLKDNSQMKTRAMEALGNMGPAAEEAADTLTNALQDPDPSLARTAMAALDKVRPAWKENLAILISALKAPDREVWRSAMAALEKGRPTWKQDVPTLISVLKASDTEVRLMAVEALSKIRPLSKEGVFALTAALEESDVRVILAAGKVLDEIGSLKEAVPKLMASLAASDLETRLNAATALGTMRQPPKEVVRALVNLLQDKNSLMKVRAAEALGNIGPAVADAAPAIAALVRDPDQAPAHSALAALDKVSPKWKEDPSLLRAAGVPLVEKYLHSGELAKGEQALEAALAAAPKDDQIRFGLGVLQFIRGVEGLGQSLHKYGTKSENTNIPFLRLPVPNNPDPATIDYTALRRVLDDFYRDLARAEATLAGVTDDKVKLRLRLAGIRLDLDRDGKPTDKFMDILKKIMQRERFDFLASNPDFLVCFDRGDVAWLRAYCHLLMGMLDFYLALDTEQLFDLSADELFAKPKHPFRSTAEEKQQKITEASRAFAVKEPARLGRFRKHLVKVAELNRETWKHIRAETDDDHEWLPNPKQTGVLGLPVRDEMIDAWLAMVAELEALLEGKRAFPQFFISKNGKGLNLKTLLDDPPEKLVLDIEGLQSLPDKYWSEAADVDTNALMRVIEIFGNPTAMAYAAWFN